jgi:hypothetical protein
MPDCLDVNSRLGERFVLRLVAARPSEEDEEFAVLDAGT